MPQLPCLVLLSKPADYHQPAVQKRQLRMLHGLKVSDTLETMQGKFADHQVWLR